MAAAPTHYIRTIHTSFTAAHPHTSSWASSARTGAPAVQRSTHSAPTSAAGLLNIGANANTHYQPQQYHLVPKYPPPGLSYGRRRASAVSVSSRPARVSAPPPPPPVKFDPFADEPLPAPSASRLPISPPPAPRPAHAHLPRSPARLTYSGPTAAPPRRAPAPLYTIQIPERAPSPTRTSSIPLSSPPRTPSPPQARPSLKDKDACSKLVAGILLNRVHAVGRPMRRRVCVPGYAEKREYVKSGLSTCIAVEA